MSDLNDPSEFYRQAKIAQRHAERSGFVGTATALAAIAEMLIQEADVDAEVITQFAPRAPASPMGPFPVGR